MTKQEAERLFGEAYDMPEGMARHEALERAARAADATDHLPLAVTCRISLIRSSYDLGRYDLMLAPFAWCRATEQRDPSAFDEYEVRSFDWAHKWIVGGLRQDPRFSLAQIESIIEQLAARYQQHGYSMQPVHGARADLAFHIGDHQAFLEHFGRYLAIDRGPMSDCEACVIEEQVTHLVHLERHEEAVAHAEPMLDNETGCATQPQGILTAVLPALVHVGDLDRARHAHLVAYRLIKDDAVTSYVNPHLEFCATSGNVERGVDILRRNLHKVHHAVSPSAAMHFGAAAALLLSRVEDDAEFDVPHADGVTRFTAAGLREELSARALSLAGEFDRRNGSTACTERTRKTLARKDTVPVPLAVPAAAVVAEAEVEPSGDPVEVATRMVEAYDHGDFITGGRLLRSLPADLDPLLPAGLSAQAAIRRMISGGEPFSEERFESALDSLEADVAIRYRARVSVWHTEGVQIAEQCLTDARSAFTKVIAALSLAELVDMQHQHERATALIADAHELAAAEAPFLLPRVLVDRAEHLARQQDLDGAASLLASLAEMEVPPSVRFDLLRIKLRLETVTGQAAAALATGAEFAVTFTGGAAGEARFLHAMAIEELGAEAEQLGPLREAVAASRVHLSPAHTAKACYVLSAGYLKTNRFVEAAETLEESLRLIEEGQDELALQVRFRLGQVCKTLGELPAAEQHLRGALELVEEGEDGQRAFTLDALASVLHRAGDGLAAAEIYREAAGCWTRAQDVPEAVGSWIEVANVLPVEERKPAEEALREAGELLPGVEDEHARTGYRAQIAAIQAFLHLKSGEFAQAVAANAQAERLAGELGDLNWQIFLVGRGARILLDASDAEGAEPEARRAARLLVADTPEQLIGDVVSVLSETLKQQGKPVGSDPLVRALTARLES